MSDKIKGRMAVYTGDHRLKEERLYYSSAGMKRIMGEWMKEYQTEGAYITVRPYYDDDHVKEKYRLHIPVIEEVKRPRPPAQYTNIRAPWQR